MTATIIILAYVANVFLNRWLNYKLYKIDKYYTPYIVLWFMSTVGTIILLVHLFYESDYRVNMKNKYWNWFNGKNW